jgi:hypothetical protein
MTGEDSQNIPSQQSTNNFNTRKQQNFAFAPKVLQESRIAICRECPARIGDNCAVCSCTLPSKIRILNTKCPIKKW